MGGNGLAAANGIAAFVGAGFHVHAGGTLAERLSETGYEAHITPFGYLNEWDLSVYGESLAKVWKQI